MVRWPVPIARLNLWETEKLHITPGTLASVFPTRFGLVGLIICWDISFPAMFAEMVAQGVELVVSPAYWSFTRPSDDVQEVVDDDILLVDSLCTTGAFKNNILFAYCNAAERVVHPGWRDGALRPNSQITHPLNKVVVKAEGNAEEVLFARLVLERAQAPLPRCSLLL